MWPAVSGLCRFAGIVRRGVRNFYALMSFGLCAFVLVTVAIEFFKGARAIRGKSGSNLLRAMFELTHRNTRRYGGYLVHMGVVIMFIGFTGKAFNRTTRWKSLRAKRCRSAHYDLHVGGVESGQNKNYQLGHPEDRRVKDGQRIWARCGRSALLLRVAAADVGGLDLRRRLNEDLYLNFAGPSNDGDGYVLQCTCFRW